MDAEGHNIICPFFKCAYKKKSPVYCTKRRLFFIVPRLFEENGRDTVFGFPWGVVRGSEFLVGTLTP